MSSCQERSPAYAEAVRAWFECAAGRRTRNTLCELNELIDVAVIEAGAARHGQCERVRPFGRPLATTGADMVVDPGHRTTNSAAVHSCLNRAELPCSRELPGHAHHRPGAEPEQRGDDIVRFVFPCARPPEVIVRQECLHAGEHVIRHVPAVMSSTKSRPAPVKERGQHAVDIAQQQRPGTWSVG